MEIEVDFGDYPILDDDLDEDGYDIDILQEIESLSTEDLRSITKEIDDELYTNEETEYDLYGEEGEG